jgi:hypothetical protein
MVSHPSRPADRPKDRSTHGRQEMAQRPLVHFLQAMPEYGPAACQERIGPHLPEGYVIRLETSD